ncbi:MAG TPA: SDR family oxidoreductase [Gemmatimonadaceae bacterium]
MKPSGTATSPGDGGERASRALREGARTWLVTGAAGFIGSNLVELLLRAGQKVVGLDNFVTGHRHNVDDVAQAGNGNGDEFRFLEGDIADPATAREACSGVDIVLHEAALGSVPRSIVNPLETNRANVDGFLTMLEAARDAGVRRFVYAGSSAVYGDHPGLPKKEEYLGAPLSPYAVTKRVNELYADVFHRTFGMEIVGLRYFNVFGRRQDPEGAYAAVIPKWIATLLAGRPCEILGDGETSRDFCYIDNVLQANVLAALAPAETVAGEIYNVAVGERTTLNELYYIIRDTLAEANPELRDLEPVYGDERPGDVKHSLADISKIRSALGYAPTHDVSTGLAESLAWYRRAMSKQPA